MRAVDEKTTREEASSDYFLLLSNLPTFAKNIIIKNGLLENDKLHLLSRTTSNGRPIVACGESIILKSHVVKDPILYVVTNNYKTEQYFDKCCKACINAQSIKITFTDRFKMTCQIEEAMLKFFIGILLRLQIFVNDSAVENAIQKEKVSAQDLIHLRKILLWALNDLAAFTNITKKQLPLTLKEQNVCTDLCDKAEKRTKELHEFLTTETAQKTILEELNSYFLKEEVKSITTKKEKAILVGRINLVNGDNAVLNLLRFLQLGKISSIVEKTIYFTYLLDADTAKHLSGLEGSSNYKAFYFPNIGKESYAWLEKHPQRNDILATALLLWGQFDERKTTLKNSNRFKECLKAATTLQVNMQ